MKTLLRAASLVVVLAGVGVSTPAFAAGSTATTTTVEALRPTAMSGQGLVFRAMVTPTKVGSTRLTGSVAWTVTGHDGSTVPCTTVTPINNGGKSDCKIAKVTVLAGSSPLTVTASYSGDGTFGASSGTTTQDVTPAPTRVHIVIATKPTSGASTTIQAYVRGGPGTPLLTGLVTFAVVSSYSARGVKTYCEGSATPITANNAQPIIGGFATCTLPSGWFVVPTASNAYKHPRTFWSVSASYDGNASFTPITSALQGHSAH